MDIQIQKNRNMAQKLADAGQILQNAALDVAAHGVEGGEGIKEVVVELETGKVKFITEMICG